MAASEGESGETEPPGLFDALFGRTAVAPILSDRARIQAMLDFEAALAAAEAETGVVPEAAVAPIAAACRAEGYDLAGLGLAAGPAGNLAIPLVKALTRRVAEVDREAAGWVHWGATSQDVIDTGMVLQLRAVADLVARDLQELGDRLADLARRHRDTPMIGRTFLQHAVPVTFGLKVAGWLSALTRHRDRLSEMRPRVLVLQLGGAAGTLSALGDRGLAVSEALARRLGLGLPDLPWHGHRDRLAEAGAVLAGLTGSLGKIARDLGLMAQTEIDELREGAEPGRGGSSTMPHKRNPVAAMAVLANSRQAPALASLLFSGLDQEHERGLGPWHAEWETWPRLAALAHGSLVLLRDAVAGLEVDAAHMRANLDRTGGLVMTESVQMALARRLGRGRAHDLLEQVAKRCVRDGASLREVLRADPEISRTLTEAEIDAALDPMSYVGEAPALVDRALDAWARRPRPPEADRT